MAKKKSLKPAEISLKALSDKALSKLWLEMRREFETTPIGIRAITRKYGIKSHTIVLRKVQEEDWRKDPAMMSAHIATEQVLDVLSAPQPGSESAKTGPEPGAADHPDSANDAEKTEKTVNPRKGLVAGPLAVADQSGAVRAARRMADVQKNQILREIAAADQVMMVSQTVLTTLENVLLSDDPAVIASMIAKFRAFTSKEESFSSLLRAAVAGVKEGVALRRRALNMEKQLAPAATENDVPEDVQRLLPTMTPEQLMLMRRAADMLNKQIEQLPQVEAEVVDGVAQAILDGGAG